MEPSKDDISISLYNTVNISQGKFCFSNRKIQSKYLSVTLIVPSQMLILKICVSEELMAQFCSHSAFLNPIKVNEFWIKRAFSIWPKFYCLMKWNPVKQVSQLMMAAGFIHKIFIVGIMTWTVGEVK